MDLPWLAELETLDGYRRLFTDLSAWTPVVEAVLRRHALEPSGPIRLGVPGTCPTFLAAGRWVVKFFGRLFDGESAFAVEQEAARLAAGDPGIRAVPLVASGRLAARNADGWPWPYLIFPLIPGERIGAQMARLPAQARLRLAAELGDMIRRLHRLPLAGSPVFASTHAQYRQFLNEQRAGLVDRLRAWGSLPEHLLRGVEQFMRPVDALIDDSRPPHLIHADLTDDHLLGETKDGYWQINALIDFGDARSGGLLYELGALHFSLFRADRRLLAAFLDAYGLPRARRAGLARKALAAALLHQFDLFGETALPFDQLPNLDALAHYLYGEPDQSAPMR